MARTQKLSKNASRVYRSLVAAAFITTGMFQLVAPAFADGTAAGTPINNTATATYEDGSGNTLNATSNTVTVTVAEVAGITVTPFGAPEDITTPSDPVKVGDVIAYTYEVKNVGNDPTKFRVPNLATTTGPGVVEGVLPGGVEGKFQYSTDGGANWTNFTGTELETSSIPVNGSILVRVPVKVQDGANADDVITVTLGNTASANAQNIERTGSEVNGGDVFTVDNPDSDGAPEIPGTPINNTREASATQQVTVGAVQKNLALATLLKERATNGYNDNSTPTDITDDTLQYNLSLRVENNDVTGQGITPKPLTGRTGIDVDGDDTKKYILVSDAIPVGTELNAGIASADVPSNWKAVYTTVSTGTNADATTWKTFNNDGTLKDSDTLASITRVGFVKEITVTDGSQDIPVNTTITGFTFTVKVKSTTSSPLTVNNIAQVFGATPDDTDPANQTPGLSVYDESGDQNPANYDGPIGSMTPPTGTDTDGDGLPDDSTKVNDTINNGVADPATQGVDASNDNSGTGPAGEVNSFLIQAQVAANVLNGPSGAADAIGPDGTTNTDFTNKSSFVPANTAPGSTINPQPVAFTNTIQNTGTSAGRVAIKPIPLDNAKDLPNGTTVTITYPGVPSAVYTFDQTNNTFNLTSGTEVIIPNVAAGAPDNYGVEVDLPDGTKLSTDTIPDDNNTGDTEFGYPIPIEAHITNAQDTTGKKNVTIDRVYTGYLQLMKVSRLLQGTGPQVPADQTDFNSTPAFINTDVTPNVTIDPDTSTADVPRTPLPGNIIEYQIRYKNISDPQAGSKNIILEAQSVVITEDGDQNGNNWGRDNDGDGVIDSSNVTTPQAVDSAGGTVQFFSGETTSKTPSSNQTGTTPATDVTKYVDTANGNVTPGEQRTFTFQRKVN